MTVLNPYSEHEISKYFDYAEFSSLLHNQSNFFRVNTLKISLSDFHSFTELNYEKTVFPEVFCLNEVPDFKVGNTLDHFTGLIFSQSLSSCFVSKVLDPIKNQTIIDACASPGAKTSHLSSLLSNSGVILACEKDKHRTEMLVSNLSRMGCMNVIIKNHDFLNLFLNTTVDSILVDVPCSGLGTLKGLTNYEPNEDLPNLQYKLLEKAFSKLKNGGTLVYSTCTFRIEENEEVIKKLLESKQNAKLQDTGYSSYSEKSFDSSKEFNKTLRLSQKKTNSEYFFIAKIKKDD